MTSAAFGTLHRDARPPRSMDAAPAPHAAEVTNLRITATQRPWILPRLIDPPAPGHRPDDPLVRRYWTALIGPGAVADLLRITAAARTCRPLRRPVHLGELIGDGLAHHRDGIVMVQRDIPHLDDRHLRRLRPALRQEYLALTST